MDTGLHLRLMHIMGLLIGSALPVAGQIWVKSLDWGLQDALHMMGLGVPTQKRG